MDSLTLKLASELPRNLTTVLRNGGYAATATKVAGLREPSPHAIYEKIGMDLMLRLRDRRQISSGLSHLEQLGG
jgi:hypothetical protein